MSPARDLAPNVHFVALRTSPEHCAMTQVTRVIKVMLDQNEIFFSPKVASAKVWYITLIVFLRVA